MLHKGLALWNKKCKTIGHPRFRLHLATQRGKRTVVAKVDCKALISKPKNMPRAMKFDFDNILKIPSSFYFCALSFVEKKRGIKWHICNMRLIICSTFKSFFSLLLWTNFLKRPKMRYHGVCNIRMILSLLIKLRMKLTVSWSNRGIS